MSLFQLILSFFKIGSMSFGGYMSLVSMIETDLVRNKSWLSQDKIVEAIALASFLPGPLAVNISTYIGYSLRSWTGAMLTMLSVLLPSFALVTVLTHYYLVNIDLPWVNGFFVGVMPAVVAIIIKVGIGMAKKNLSNPYQYFLVGLTLILSSIFGGLSSILLTMAICTFFTYLWETDMFRELPHNDAKIHIRYYAPSVIVPLGLLSTGYLILELDLFNSIYWELVKVFSLMSVTLFGGGYVFIPMMQEIIVDQKAWLSNQEFVDAIAIGQITPGPILISAAFVGYKLKGMVGAAVATLSIFLPSSILMVVVGVLYKEVSDNPHVQILFKGIKTAIVGLILFSAVLIAHNSDSTVYVALLAMLSFGALQLFKINPILLILLNGILGIFASQ